MLSVVIPTHNPDAGRLAHTLRGLRAQTLPADRWETILVDNASSPPVSLGAFRSDAPVNLTLVSEPRLGLTAARCCGFRAARGDIIVLVDDDNVLAPDYLERAAALFAAQPRLGAAGGKSLPHFEREPAPWQREFFALLAIRDLGDQPQCTSGLRPAGSTVAEYPRCAPIGAGMVLRRTAALAWVEQLERDPGRKTLDRTGSALTSGGDNDIVLTVLAADWSVGYFPELQLTHLIPTARLDPDYLARLNRAIQRSWMRVLALHHANPWPPIPRWSVRPRQLKAWLTHRAWSSPAARIRWHGACGHFEGRVSPDVPA